MIDHNHNIFNVLSILFYTIVLMLWCRQKTQGTQKKVDRKTNIQVTETKYKWTGLDSG